MPAYQKAGLQQIQCNDLDTSSTVCSFRLRENVRFWHSEAAQAQHGEERANINQDATPVLASLMVPRRNNSL